MNTKLLDNIDKTEAYVFGTPSNLEDLNVDRNKFKVVKITKKFIYCKSEINKAYRAFISLRELIPDYNDLRLKIEYKHGNVFAYSDEKDLPDKLKFSNEIYFVFDLNKELIFATIGLPIKPNSLYGKSNLDNIISNVKKFNTLPGSNRVEINVKNDSFFKYDDIVF